MTPLQKFEHSYDHLKRIHKKQKPSHRDLLDASREIFLLFLDSGPLVDLINKDVRYKFKFSFVEYNPPKGMIASILPISSGNPGTYHRDKFFKATAFYYGGKPHSVHDLIKFYRNTKGGVHFEENNNLKKLSELMKTNGNEHEAYDHQMICVLKSVVDALDDFVNVLKK